MESYNYQKLAFNSASFYIFLPSSKVCSCRFIFYWAGSSKPSCGVSFFQEVMIFFCSEGEQLDLLSPFIFIFFVSYLPPAVWFSVSVVELFCCFFRWFLRPSSAAYFIIILFLNNFWKYNIINSLDVVFLWVEYKTVFMRLTHRVQSKFHLLFSAVETN